VRAAKKISIEARAVQAAENLDDSHVLWSIKNLMCGAENVLVHKYPPKISSAFSSTRLLLIGQKHFSSYRQGAASTGNGSWHVLSP
jgi:hypothetical protein